MIRATSALRRDSAIDWNPTQTGTSAFDRSPPDCSPPQTPSAMSAKRRLRPSAVRKHRLLDDAANEKIDPSGAFRSPDTAAPKGDPPMTLTAEF